ncbi:uncharacterized protein LOC115756717 [Rhodamnia argentea]|uniref:Uncharacterized protein LOC115756717 n=1 Tax=Rhodamnia argentea TaxID=178133 RepID=A0ABM3HJ20_9MYRT|nr:uncharacterized protein LOC115756717 [Rhodamnia argentea]
MERKDTVIDVSPFSLIEATGDSEADSDLAVTRNDPGLTSSAAYDGGGDCEDAESCSSEWSSYELCNNHDVWDLDGGDTVAGGGADESDPWRWTGETGYNEHVEQRRRWLEGEGPSVSEEVNSFDNDEEINKKPSGIVSSEVHLSETEKSRLFWEACLAS